NPAPVALQSRPGGLRRPDHVDRAPFSPRPPCCGTLGSCDILMHLSHVIRRRQMTTTRVKVAEGGRIVIPAEYRKRLGVQVGDNVILQLDDGEIRLFTVREAIRRAQEMVRRYVPEGVSLVDELIAERRAEAARE